MKKNKISMFIIFYLLIFNIIFAVDERDYIFYTGKAYEYNEFLKDFVEQEYKIVYNEENELFINVKESIDDSWIYITELKIQKKIIENLEKYLEWEEIALKNSTSIKKTLPESEITTMIAWEQLDKWYFSNNFTLSFMFFTKEESNYLLRVSSNKVTTPESVLNHSISDLYLTSYEVKKLLEIFINLDKKIKEAQKQIKDKELFN